MIRAERRAAMRIKISLELQEFVDALVASGRFSSQSEVITAALLALEQQEEMARYPDGAIEAIYPRIDEMIAKGLADVRAGRLSDGEEFFDELERELLRDLPEDRENV